LKKGITKRKQILYLKKALVGVLALGIIFLFSPLKLDLLKDPYSTVIEDKNGILLSAQIAEDGQWRFPILDDLPEKFVKCITTYEDKRFFNHFGIDPIAIARAIRQNITVGKIVSGGSTLSMQVMRMSGRNKKRTLLQKSKETLNTLRLEAQFSKKEILQFYAAHAPFGGNVVGLETASRKYYNKSPNELSWAQMSTLCVLPNAPSLIRMDRNADKLIKKRNQLLQKLYDSNFIDHIELELSLSEDLNYGHFPIPHHTPHLLAKAKKESNTGRIRTTLDGRLQKRMNDLLDYHYGLLSQKSIHNAAVFIINTQTQEVIAYSGNIPSTTEEASVDMVSAPRSSGSILKPFLYASMIDQGFMAPHSFVQDIPIFIDGFNPKNYNDNFAGILPVSVALSQSLNVPFVLLLQEYGVDKFRRELNNIGLTTINKSANHYGLSLILGGAEVRLDQLTTAYSHMGRQLFDYDNFRGKYSSSLYPKSQIILNPSKNKRNTPRLSRHPKQSFSASSIYHTFDAMKKVLRPGTHGGWDVFPSSNEIAWKTGTSYGHRDAWAIGVHPQYTIGVWVGNADGEGRDEIVGVSTAGNILFDAFDRISMEDGWWAIPYDDMDQVVLCKGSGMLPSVHCNDQIKEWVSKSTFQSDVCHHHISVLTDSTKKYAVNRLCYDMDKAQKVSYFKFSPLVSKYYKRLNGNIADFPSRHPECEIFTKTSEEMELTYPSPSERIYIPRDFNSNRQKIVAQLEHSNPKVEVFWYLNGEYLGATKDFHTMSFDGQAGGYALLCIDQSGTQIERNFEIVGK
tara:strand:+ start:1059 stop:3443 length:2385 start_codon:yes stop_codon:yes gene_type:complete